MPRVALESWVRAAVVPHASSIGHRQGVAVAGTDLTVAGGFTAIRHTGAENGLVHIGW